MVERSVQSDHIAHVISRWTGIPVDKMLEGERDKLLRMEAELGERVIGQAEAARCRFQGGASCTGRSAGSEPSDRVVHVPWANRCRQNRVDQIAGGFPVR